MELIAEIGQAHDGSLGILHSYIDSLSKTGVDTIKFQVHIAEAESSELEEFRIKFSYQDATRYDYWERMSFTFDQWVEIKKHVEDKNINFLATPFSITAVEWLERIGVKRYKIGSGDSNNYLLLNHILKTKKPIILSSGMSSFEEIDFTVNYMKDCADLSILQCTTEYPTSPESLGLNVIGEMKERYKDKKIGFSDHSGNIYPPLAAASLGAEIIETHVVFDREMFGPDSKSSLTIKEFSDLANGLDIIDRAKKAPINKSSIFYNENTKKVFSKSLATRKEIKKGDVIKLDDLESKKPRISDGIDISDFETVLGRRAVRDLSQFQFIKKEDVI